jgi:hypothetical protein
MTTDDVRYGAVRRTGPRSTTAPAAPWVERLVEHFTRIAAGPDGTTKLVEQEGAVLAALRCAADAECWHEALRLVRHAEPAFASSARWGAWKVVLEHALAAGRKVGDRSVEGWALHQLGVRSLALGEEAEAERLLGEALAVRREAGEDEAAALTESQLALLPS